MSKYLHLVMSGGSCIWTAYVLYAVTKKKKNLYLEFLSLSLPDFAIPVFQGRSETHNGKRDRKM